MFMVRCKIPGGRVTADQYLALDELAGAIRQRHAADHHPAGHSVPRRSQDESEVDHRRHQSHLADNPRRLRRRESQRDGVSRPASQDGVRANCKRPPPASPPTSPRRPGRYHEIWLNGKFGVQAQRRTARWSRFTARSICRASSRWVSRVPEDNCSTSMPRTLACWPSWSMAGSPATTCSSAAAWA